MFDGVFGAFELKKLEGFGKFIKKIGLTNGRHVYFGRLIDHHEVNGVNSEVLERLIELIFKKIGVNAMAHLSNVILAD